MSEPKQLNLSQDSVETGDTAPSPFAESKRERNWKAKSAQKKKAKTEQAGLEVTVQVCHVEPVLDPNVTGNPIEGFAVCVSGFGDNALGKPFYSRNNYHHQKFFEATKPVMHCFHCNDVTGNIDMRGQYPTKYLIKLLDEANYPTSEDLIRSWVTNIFAPALKAIPGGLWKHVAVVPHPTDFYRSVETWNELISEDEATFMIRDDFVGRGNDYPNMASFWQVRKHLYSFYRVGQVPHSVIDEHRLEREHLLQLDIDDYDWTERDAENAAAAAAAAIPAHNNAAGAANNNNAAN